jgi:hypothetical protein
MRYYFTPARMVITMGKKKKKVKGRRRREWEQRVGERKGEERRGEKDGKDVEELKLSYFAGEN